MGCKADHLDSDKGGTASASCLNSRVSKSWAAAGVAALSPGRLMSSPRAPSNCPALHLPSACTTIDHATSQHCLFTQKADTKTAVCTHARFTYMVTLTDLKQVSALCKFYIEGSVVMPRSGCYTGPHAVFLHGVKVQHDNMLSGSDFQAGKV